jgi:hypothetical protein
MLNITVDRLTTARLVVFGFYMQSGSGVAGKSPEYIRQMLETLSLLDTVDKIEACLPADIGHCWNNYKLLWPHDGNNYHD